MQAGRHAGAHLCLGALGLLQHIRLLLAHRLLLLLQVSSLQSIQGQMFQRLSVNSGDLTVKP